MGPVSRQRILYGTLSSAAADAFIFELLLRSSNQRRHTPLCSDYIGLELLCQLATVTHYARFPLPELTARVNGPSWRVTSFRQLGPLTRAVNSGSGNRALRKPLQLTLSPTFRPFYVFLPLIGFPFLKLFLCLCAPRLNSRRHWLIFTKLKKVIPDCLHEHVIAVLSQSWTWVQFSWPNPTQNYHEHPDPLLRNFHAVTQYRVSKIGYGNIWHLISQKITN